MKNPTPTSGRIFGEDGETSVHGIGVSTGDDADRHTADRHTGDASAVDRYVGLSDDDLEVSIVDLKHRIDASQADLLLRVAEYHRRGLGELRHMLSTVGWIRQALRLTSADASGTDAKHQPHGATHTTSSTGSTEATPP